MCVFVWGFFFFPSSGVSWKKTVLKACLKESFKNLTLCWPSSSQCVVRKDFPPGLGGSDICHFCSKRVYVMERLSAEGYFFHRECFRCDACNCTLRLGGHTFDSQEGTLHLLDLPLKPVGDVTSKYIFFSAFCTAKFYCKLHYAQRLYSNNPGRVRRRMVRNPTFTYYKVNVYYTM